MLKSIFDGSTKRKEIPKKKVRGNNFLWTCSNVVSTRVWVGVQMETMSTHDPLQKQMAKEKKQEKIHDAEAHKQEARQHNAAAKQNEHSD